MVTLKNIIDLGNLDNLLKDSSHKDKVLEIRELILNGYVPLYRNVVPEHYVKKIIQYLEAVGKNSLPNYTPIYNQCPNSHRINDRDNRSYVKGCFQQFQFFPWNQDPLQLFEKLKFIFHFKNLLNLCDTQKYLGQHPDDDCIARVSFQFYPSGGGYLNKHKDPLDIHQIALPSLVMSKKGRDFSVGGVYIEDENHKFLEIEENLNIGDLYFFNPQLIHGVNPIDPELEFDWLSLKGRWMGLFAINKLTSNKLIGNSEDLNID